MILDDPDSELEKAKNLEIVPEHANFIMSSKGNQLVVDKAGYVYHRHRTLKNKTINWRCQEGRDFCNARLKTQDYHIITLVGAHTHSPPNEKNFQMKINNF